KKEMTMIAMPRLSSTALDHSKNWSSSNRHYQSNKKILSMKWIFLRMSPASLLPEKGNHSKMRLLLLLLLRMEIWRIWNCQNKTRKPTIKKINPDPTLLVVIVVVPVVINSSPRKRKRSSV
ncbi:hypothetical protein H4219_005028, partial [Mycoemilia scoparia]